MLTPALEWLAAMCSHIPNKGEQMVRYYGYYSNVSRGKKKINNTKVKTSTKKIEFEFPAFSVKVVSVVGNFNNWDVDEGLMVMVRYGVWTKSMNLKTGIYEYRFFVDGGWVNDPTCSTCAPNEFGSSNCVKIVE